MAMKSARTLGAGGWELGEVSLMMVQCLWSPMVCFVMLTVSCAIRSSAAKLRNQLFEDEFQDATCDSSSQQRHITRSTLQRALSCLTVSSHGTSTPSAESHNSKDICTCPNSRSQAHKGTAEIEYSLDELNGYLTINNLPLHFTKTYSPRAAHQLCSQTLRPGTRWQNGIEKSSAVGPGAAPGFERFFYGGFQIENKLESRVLVQRSWKCSFRCCAFPGSPFEFYVLVPRSFTWTR